MTKQEIELVEVLITISIVSKRLAHNLMKEEKTVPEQPERLPQVII